MIRFTLLTALLLAPLVANAQQTTSPDTVRDRLWLSAVPADVISREGYLLGY